MPRLLIIPDVHNAVGWAEAILTRFESAVDRTVFLGDYFDSWDDSRLLARDSARWLQAGLADRRRIYLFGNHDISYYAAGQATLCSGWTPEKAAVIEAVMRPPRGPDHWSALKCFHCEDGWLFTHAGLRSDLLQPPDLKPGAPAMEELFRRGLANVARNVPDPVFGAGAYRLGTFALGGVTWLDFNEAWECRESLVRYHQVVGHSALPVLRSIFRDADGFATVALEGRGPIPIPPPAQSFSCIDARGRAFAIVDTAQSTLTVYHCEEAGDTLVVGRETVLKVKPVR